MDLISKYSPSSSVSPPISPIKLFNHPSNNSLPPLKNLPVWNRPGLEKNRFIRSITKDSPELEKAELLWNHLTSRSTQTSPPSTAVNNFNGLNLAGNKQDVFNDGKAENSSVTLEKRLFFVQSEHEIVLKRLHSEIEKLNNEKKELNFKFVMTKNGISVSSDNKEEKHSAGRRGSLNTICQGSGTRKKSATRSSDNRVSSSSKEGSKNRRPLFKPGGTRNPVLETKQIHRMKSGSKSAKFSTSDSTKKSISDSQNLVKFNKHEKPTQVSSNAENVEENNIMVLRSKDEAISADGILPAAEKSYSSEDYEEIIRGLQRMNAKQANELSHLRDKLVEQRQKPLLEQPHIHPENRLPKLAMQSTVKSAKMPQVAREKHEILTLPALRPQKFANRQRKAQASHMQRQKVNKEFLQKFA